MDNAAHNREYSGLSQRCANSQSYKVMPVPVLSYVYKRATSKKQENKIRASEVVEDISEELHNLNDRLTYYRQ